MLDFPNSSAAAGDPGGPSCAMHGASFALLVLAAVAAMATPGWGESDSGAAHIDEYAFWLCALSFARRYAESACAARRRSAPLQYRTARRSAPLRGRLGAPLAAARSLGRSAPLRGAPRRSAPLHPSLLDEHRRAT